MRLPAAVLADIRQHAREAAPLECCGVIVAGWAVYARRAHNAEESTWRYSIAPAELIEIVEHTRRWGGRIAGIYHSHPGGKAELSATDMRLADDWPDVMHLVTDGDEVRGYVLRDGVPVEVLYDSGERTVEWVKRDGVMV